MRAPRIVWLLGGWLALTLVGAFGIAMPTWRSFQDLRQEAGDLEGRLAREEDGAAQVRRLEHEIEELRRRAEHETKPIPKDSDVAGLIRELSEELARLGLHEREITTGAPTTVGKVRSLPMMVTLYGEFPSVYASVRWIEQLPRLVRVQRVRIEVDNRKKPATAQATPPRKIAPPAEAQVAADAAPVGPPVKAELMLDVYFDPEAVPAMAPDLADASEGADS